MLTCWAVMQPSPIVTEVAAMILVPGQIKQHRPISILPELFQAGQTVSLTFLSGVAMTLE